MRLLIVICLAGCLDYDALTRGEHEDLSATGDLGDDGMSDADRSLVPPDLTDVDIVGDDLAGQDLVGADLALAAPHYVGSQSLVITGGKTNAVPPPAGTQAGDVIVLVVWWNDSANIPVLSGQTFNALVSTAQAGTQSARWFWRRAVANEGSFSYHLTFANTADSAMTAMTFRGVSMVVASTAAVRVASDWPTSVTTTAPNTAVIASTAFAQNPGSWTAPAGFGLAGGSVRTEAFLDTVPSPQVVSISQPQSVGVDPLLTAVLQLQP